MTDGPTTSGAASPTPPAGDAAEMTAEQADQTIRSPQYVGLLVVVAVVGVIVSLAAWCFLEALHQLQQLLYSHLPHTLGYAHGYPKWWPLPILMIGAAITAVAIKRLPGNGGHIPANGLATGGPSSPGIVPGVLIAGLGTVGFGLVLGPEAPLIALGGGVALALIGLSRRETPPQAITLVAAAGTFAALSFIFESPLIAAVILIEAAGLGGPRLRVVLLPGLLAAGIGALVSVGIGHFTGLSTSDYALGPLPLTAATHPTLVEFLWTIGVAALIGALATVIMRGGRRIHALLDGRRLLVALPLIALAVGALAVVFAWITGHSMSEVLFSGQDQMPGLVSQAGTWSVGALIALLAFKGVAYGLSLGSFRGGPTFPAVFLGAAAGILASHLPGFPVDAGVAIGIGAATVAILRLPLSAVVLATLLTSHAGPDVEPLIITAVVVAYIIALAVPRTLDRHTEVSGEPAAT